MTKRYINKKKILLVIALIYVFFAGFKFLKGKSFFDTIVEYSNNIYSINVDISNATRDDYSLLDFEYIPIEYIDYKEVSLGRYITRKVNSNNLYIYEPISKEERLFAEITNNFNLYEVIVDKNWVVWLEGIENSNNDNLDGISWRVYAKMINSDNKILVEQGSINEKNVKEYINYIPREFELLGDNLVYTKYDEKTINKNNIITTTMMTSLVKYNLKNGKSEVIATSSNSYKEELSNVKIDNDNIVWQKKT